MAGVLKKRLRILYSKILASLQTIPKDAAYRTYTEQLINDRFDLVKSEPDIEKLERKINCGQIEEVIVQVIVIQTYARRWHAMRLVKQLSHDRMVRLDWEKKEELRKKKEKEDRLKREYERRMHPKTKEDFDLLYHALETNSCTIGRCHQCNKLDNVAHQREDLNKYKNMLTQLRQAEAEYDKKAKIAFLLQERDLQYLLGIICATQSALSAWDDLYDLVVVQWNKYFEWSPWNCILLTKEEAAAHLKLDNVEQAYGVVFIRKMKHKHTLAKKYFSQIPAMAQFLHSRDSQPAAPGNDLLVTKPAVTQA
ncbi:IQ and ubiquitin-like domain-containing protein [Acipenser ruthenus]|uniref:IQ and ubiquitin-like domain-containing protein n=1 Tax=Acipenser ruthenus TaxID=7906 RepID=A0A444TY88_ACIRT|nr:IQ and ubiquitin-like domain-containing protein [Acipenser ruthenus]